MRYSEPGNETGEEANPGGEQDGECGHAGPEEDEADGDTGTAYDYAQDGEEPGLIYGGGVEDAAESVGF